MHKLFHLLFAISLGFLSIFSSAQDLQNYHLGSGDTIKITVWGEPDLTLETLLADTGSFNYPFLGNVTASGLTIDQLEKHITDGLKEGFLLEPDVNVQILSYRGFFIRGEVNRPGIYPFQPRLTLAKAIALAGGLTERASKSKMTILSDSDGQAEPRKATLSNVIQPGDIINIEQSFF